MDQGGQERAAVDGLSCGAFRDNAVRLRLFALAYNLANFLRSISLPSEIAQWTLRTLRERLVRIGARIVRHGRYLVFQLAEVAAPRALFAGILRRIDRVRGPPMAVARRERIMAATGSQEKTMRRSWRISPEGSAKTQGVALRRSRGPPSAAAWGEQACEEGISRLVEIAPAAAVEDNGGLERMLGACRIPPEDAKARPSHPDRVHAATVGQESLQRPYAPG